MVWFFVVNFFGFLDRRVGTIIFVDDVHGNVGPYHYSVLWWLLAVGVDAGFGALPCQCWDFWWRLAAFFYRLTPTPLHGLLDQNLQNYTAG